MFEVLSDCLGHVCESKVQKEVLKKIRNLMDRSREREERRYYCLKILYVKEMSVHVVDSSVGEVMIYD
jgi:PHP family Zn ribbon phosphoesterase